MVFCRPCSSTSESTEQPLFAEHKATSVVGGVCLICFPYLADFMDIHALNYRYYTNGEHLDRRSVELLMGLKSFSPSPCPDSF